MGGKPLNGGHMYVVQLRYQDGVVEHKVVTELHKFYVQHAKVHGMTFSMFPLLGVKTRYEAEKFLATYDIESDEELPHSEYIALRNKIYELEHELENMKLRGVALANLQRENMELKHDWDELRKLFGLR